MVKIAYEQEVEKLLEQFLSFWPLMARADHEEKIKCAVEYQLFRSNQQVVTKELLLKAIEAAFPSFETFILALKDPARMGAVAASQQSINRDNPVVKVSRWDLPDVPIQRPVRDVFALLAGPRIGGNTDCIVDAVLEGAKEQGCSIEKQCFSKLKITPCTGCLKCQDERPDTLCAIKDDMTPIYKRLLECDAFVLGFPIYSARESCHTTIFFDRLKALSNPWEPKKPEPKKGALISTWGWPSDYLYKDVVNNIAFLLRHFGVETSEVVTGGGFWGAYYEKGTANLDSAGMEQARAAGRALAS